MSISHLTELSVETSPREDRRPPFPCSETRETMAGEPEHHFFVPEHSVLADEDETMTYTHAEMMFVCLSNNCPIEQPSHAYRPT
jgi:hypothetical protein